MRWSRPFFTAPIKSLRNSPPIGSARGSVDSLLKQRPHCRSCFTLRFFGWRAVGINSRVRKEFSILFSLASAWARERLRFFFCFNAAVRCPLCLPSWLAVPRSWPSPELYFFMNRHRGNGFSVSHSRLSACSCCAGDASVLAVENERGLSL